jgi:predicted nucleic acid-binding protein
LSKKKLVLDTTICIDLFNGQLLEKVVRLPYELVLPDVIIEELIKPPGKDLIETGYTVLPLDEEGIEQIILLRERYPKPSTNDLFALMLAKLSTCSLVTGDDSLRKAAKDEGVAVHGLLWILDKLVNHSILRPLEAAKALERILAEGSWLPKKECDVRIKSWKS